MNVLLKDVLRCCWWFITISVALVVLHKRMCHSTVWTDEPHYIWFVSLSFMHTFSHFLQPGANEEGLQLMINTMHNVITGNIIKTPSVLALILPELPVLDRGTGLCPVPVV